MQKAAILVLDDWVHPFAQQGDGELRKRSSAHPLRNVGHFSS